MQRRARSAATPRRSTAARSTERTAASRLPPVCVPHGPGRPTRWNQVGRPLAEVKVTGAGVTGPARRSRSHGASSPKSRGPDSRESSPRKRPGFQSPPHPLTVATHDYCRLLRLIAAYCSLLRLFCSYCVDCGASNAVEGARKGLPLVRAGCAAAYCGLLPLIVAYCSLLR